ncbi:Deoxyribonuclease-1 [Orchesella cincta]|uniref:Deoxyribonuclease-1 n=1 Tax=Orchesella cincta TaxID=48709 RepID=A0A1D2ME34_ORCCI|nr:Deoxyribonuclease-1 [Orchesella cincta]
MRPFTIYLLIFVLALTVLVEARKKKNPEVETTTEIFIQPSEQDVFNSVLIGSFNLKQFGSKKVNSEDVLRVIAKIVSRYDLIALQEITDVKEQAIKSLMQAISFESEHPYHYVISPRVGRTKQKEQYALVFRANVFQVKNHLIFNDDEGDIFSREPQIAEVILKGNGAKFAIINVHVAPRNASTEINALVDAHSWVEDRLKLKNIILLGDLNAGCDYIRKKDRPNIRLMTNTQKYKWLIPDSQDTTVGTTKCSYDRIIISGQYMERNWLHGTAKPFEFDVSFGLEKKLALNVSDHYPVEFRLRVDNQSSPYSQTTESSSSSITPDKLTLYGMAWIIYDLLAAF